jgi:glycosyltransferase involved in cell wall biosynthesis
MYQPSISVIIPTVNRTAVRTAVLSVLNQTYAPFEVIVVVDRADNEIPAVLHDLHDKIRIVFSGGVGPSGARTRAFLESSGEVIAFLDDDDQWFPEKLERQIAMWPTGDDAKPHTMISCRFTTIDLKGQERRPVPIDVLGSGQRMADYLFRRIGLRYQHGAINPSTLICDRELLIEEPWDDRLRLHEDWNWLLRLDERGDVELMMSPEVLLEAAVGDMSSLSRSSKWEQSFAWLQEHKEHLTPREVGDFLLVYTALIAIWAGKRRYALYVAWYALTTARPGLWAWAVWSLNMLPSKLVDGGSHLLHFVRSKFPR